MCTCWVLLQSAINLITVCPVGPCWAHCKGAHQSGHWALCERTLWFLSQFCLQCVLLYTWATHWEFFQKVLIYVNKMYPGGSFQCIHNEFSIWLNFTTNSQKNHWVYGWIHCGHITGHFLKELSVSGPGIYWVHCKQNCERNQRVLSQSAQWPLWWAPLQCAQHGPTGHIVIKLMGTL